MTDQPHLLVEQDGAILICTLNRPDKLNAISKDMLQSFEQALIRFRDSVDVKVMLIRAVGRYFSAGADLVEDGGNSPLDTGVAIRELHRLKLNGMQRLWDEMEHIEKPIVVAHHATCVGGGLELSLSCDFRLASEQARYSFPEGKFGVLPASNGVSRLVRIVGAHWARYLVMGGFIADAQKAMHMGLIHELWPQEGFEERCLDFCRHLAKQHGEQMGVAKIAIEMAQDLGRDQGRQVERLANSTLMLASSYQEIYRNHVAGIGDKSKG